MKIKNHIILGLIFSLFAISCSKTLPCKQNSVTQSSEQKQIQLAEFLYKTGNIITQKHCPFLVHAPEVYVNKNNFLLIDIRSQAEYEKGHIDGAYNVQRSELADFLKDSVNTASFDKIVIIDDNGPLSEYVATLLRFDGYNAYALKFGIGSWNSKFKSNIQKYLSNKYASETDTVFVRKHKAGSIPNIASADIMKLLDKRVSELIALPTDQIIVPIDEYFANMDDYYTIAYWSASKYNNGHIKGSVRYNIRSDLSFDRELNTLPTDKKILVYCNTGHHAIAIVAYLKLLGYDAYSIMYGANSFMNQKLKTFAPGAAIIDASPLCGSFPLLTGKQRTSHKAGKIGNTQASAPPVVPVVTRKKKDGNIGGCE